ncbi:3070_t:CDS:1 [Funneliformis geosporum]|uniref:1327_t:CDS:1 n=1 Tax=Funneliformis geosporum TaxID=1117311 RepID=A0A9W4SDW0_9GLOM|nr:3070_t:CDS:1 [Funneliformis geosporum]CAI2165362.1 1327_t:CDS:1 [Funneliformis geosporum]
MPFRVLVPKPKQFSTKRTTKRIGVHSFLRKSFNERYYVTTYDAQKDWTTILSPTPFDIFALPRTASDGEIKSRYYELVKTHHPDKCGDNSPAALERFRKVVKAYEILNNRQKKAMYLRYGVGWDSPVVQNAATYNGSYGSRFSKGSSYAYYQGWEADKDTYKGEFSTTERFMSNPYFAAFVVTAAIFGAAIQYIRIENSVGWIRAAEERHHLKAANYLATARREGKLYGKRKKAEMMLDLLHVNGVNDQNICNSANISNSSIE